MNTLKTYIATFTKDIQIPVIAKNDIHAINTAPETIILKGKIVKRKSLKLAETVNG